MVPVQRDRNASPQWVWRFVVSDRANESKRPGIVVDRLSVTENDDERGPPDHGGPP
jgi:hypothetical protein